MIDQERASKLAEEILWCIENYVNLAGEPKSYGSGMIFHRQEIHLIHSIGENPGINVTELAARHKITKSAVSQAVKKLEMRHLIERFKSEENRKEVRFRLTEKGHHAYDAHLRFHKETDTPYVESLAEFGEAEVEGVRKLITLLTERAAGVRRRLAEEDNEGKGQK